MEVQRQLQVLADELNMVKNELVGMKSDHSALHNVAVETDRTMRTKLEQMETIVKQVQANAGTGMGSASKPLIEPKQIVVPEFAGSITDGRSKYLEWAERARDRVCLYNPVLAKQMEKVEGRAFWR